MKLTKATDYALVILAHLGAFPEGKSTKSKEIVKVCNVPERFLANIVYSLSKAGIIKSRKGRKGGISLAKESSRITLREVVEAIEGKIRFVDCLKSTGKCQIETECKVKRFWDDYNDAILAPLNKITLKDFMSYTNSKAQNKS